MRALLLVCLTCSLAAAEPAGDDFLAAYARDPTARAIASALHDELGHVATTGAEASLDGGYRGTIHLVPQLPVARHRTQLVWAAAALRSLDTFYRALGTRPPAYRWRDLTIRFVRSVGKRTPSALASGWTITHNVAGSLLTSERGVLETYVHELFHLNDAAHGGWSGATLAADYQAIVGRCGTRVRCLAPYAPNDTKVRATGTYYAFQPDNGDGVHEYAAELALRYFKEHTEHAARGALARPAFKCGPAENRRAWQAMVEEFFGGYDRIPPCT